MGVTIQINIPDTAPLDGSTPLPADAKDRLFTNTRLGLNQLDLLPGEAFGEFDPGELGILGQPASAYVVRHLSVVSLGAIVHADDTYVAVRTPPRPGGGSGLRIIQPLGPTLDLVAEGTGILPEGNRIPVPTGHRLIFNTIADGVGTGGHIVQMTLEPARVSGIPVAPGPRVPPPTPVPLPPLPAQLAAGAASPSSIVFGSLPNPRTITVTGVGFLTAPDDVVRFIRTSGGVPGGPIDLPFTPTIPGTSTDIVGTVPTDTIKGTFKVRVSRAADPGIYNEIDNALVIA